MATLVSRISDLTAAIRDKLNAKAPLAGPVFTGIPTAPTASAGTNTTQIATTAFVQTKANLASPTFTGTPAAPTAAAATNTTQIATTAFVQAAIFKGFSYSISGKPADGEKYPVVAPYAFTISAANTVAKAATAATGSTVFTIKRNASTTVGTITFAAAATTATVSITAGAIVAGDLITVEAAATADATLANIAFVVRA